MFKAGQLVRIKDVRKGPNSVSYILSYIPVYVIENNQRVVDKSIYLTSNRHKMKRLPLNSICLFIKENQEICHLLHEEQIVECYTDWIEPL